MPIIQDFNCDVMQEMNWVKGRNTVVGYVNALTIAGTALELTMTNLWDPIAAEYAQQAVGVMDYCGWQGGATQPLRISFLVENANQITILNLLSAGLANTAMSIQFAVYNFDQTASPAVFYPTFWSGGTPLNGVIAKEGTILALNIERERDPRIISPFLFRCDLAMAPTPGLTQTLYMANSSTANYISTFGSYNF